MSLTRPRWARESTSGLFLVKKIIYRNEVSKGDEESMGTIRYIDASYWWMGYNYELIDLCEQRQEIFWTNIYKNMMIIQGYMNLC